MMEIYHCIMQCGRVPASFVQTHSGNIKATTTQDELGWTALHSTARVEVIGLAILWELLCYNCECVAIQDDSGMTALHLVEEDNRTQPQDTRRNAKIVLLKMATNYNHVPNLPSDHGVVAIVESSPACIAIAPRLEPGNDAFVLHQALAAQCPSVFVEALLQIFPNQAQQEYTAGRLPLHIALQHGLGASVRVLASAYPAAMFVSDPVTGRLPIQQAVLNVRIDASLDNVDAVNALLRANPAFLE